ncbi:hypothetical protein DMH02_023360 [Streptomyces sp. WAC 00631]|uniref:hypothetical protein n=1 Tax=Streptomyces sp. WAC 00631 TaxID=2203201 RepID=UPI000F79797A|nr:hypothetical protein [Streptomyces sp. WAC 00631]MCC5036058.1 hypothetical protein [Streptomyces sp. WAC 00631]
MACPAVPDARGDGAVRGAPRWRRRREVTGLGSGALSAGEVAAAGETFENTGAQPVHDGHAVHGEHTVHGEQAGHGKHAAPGAAGRRDVTGGTRKVVSAGERPAASTTAVTTTAAAGAALAAFAGGAVVFNRRRRAAATD